MFEAMSAIEIMDPKMDAGMLCNKTRKVVQFKPAVDVSFIIMYMKIILHTLPQEAHDIRCTSEEIHVHVVGLPVVYSQICLLY